MVRVFFIAFLFCAFFKTYSQTVVKGKDQNLAGQDLIHFRYLDPFFGTRINIDTITIDKEGFFEYQINEIKTLPLFFGYGDGIIYFYPETGKKNSISFPENDQSGMGADSGKPVLIESQCMDCRDTTMLLNNRILRFSKKFDPFYALQVLRYYDPELGKTKLDSFLRSAGDMEDTASGTYFRNWKRFKTGLLEITLRDYNLEHMISEYMVNNEADFNNPAYTDLFRIMFDRYFDHLRNKEKFRLIYPTFNKMNPAEFREWLQSEPVMQNDTIFEVIYIHEAYLGYYAKRVSKELFKRKLDSLSQEAVYPGTKIIINELYERLFRMLPGNTAPHFTVRDQKGEVVDPSSDKPLIYISFCSINSLSCIKEMKYLDYLYRKHDAYLEIISFLEGGGRKEIEKFASENDYAWHLVPVAETGDLQNRYQVRNYPVFILLDENGRILRNPAPAPSQDIERTLFMILRSMGRL